MIWNFIKWQSKRVLRKIFHVTKNGYFWLVKGMHKSASEGWVFYAGTTTLVSSIGALIIISVGAIYFNKTFPNFLFWWCLFAPNALWTTICAITATHAGILTYRDELNETMDALKREYPDKNERT
jgi:hypothetical protein